MNIIKKVCKIVFSLVIVIVIAFILHIFFNKGIKVTVENQSGNRIDSLSLQFRGGHYQFGELFDGQRIKTHIYPSGDMSLTFQWREGDNEYHEHSFSYFEKAYRGRVKLTFRPNKRIEYSEKVSTTFIPDYHSRSTKVYYVNGEEDEATSDPFKGGK